MMQMWLLYFRERPPCPASRIADSRIDAVREHSKTDKGWVVLVTYSVLPGPEGRERWLVGNGQLAPGGWVEAKTVFLFMRDEGAHAYLDQMTTSPPPSVPATTVPR